MHCDDVREKLTSFFYDELPSDESDSVREHVRDCDDCATVMASLRTVTQSLDGWKPIEAEQPVSALLDEVADVGPVIGTIEPRRRRWLPWAVGVAAGLALAMFVLAAGAEVSRDDGRLTISFGRAVGEEPAEPQPAELSEAQVEELKSMLVEHVDANTVFGLELVNERFNELEHAQDERFLALVHTIRAMREEDMQRFEQALTALAMDTAHQTQETRAALSDIAQQVTMRP